MAAEIQSILENILSDEKKLSTITDILKSVNYADIDREITSDESSITHTGKLNGYINALNSIKQFVSSKNKIKIELIIKLMETADLYHFLKNYD